MIAGRLWLVAARGIRRNGLSVMEGGYGIEIPLVQGHEGHALREQEAWLPGEWTARRVTTTLWPMRPVMGCPMAAPSAAFRGKRVAHCTATSNTDVAPF
jgi:hypothetical protein